MAIENRRFKTRAEREEEEKKKRTAGGVMLPTYEELTAIEEKAKEDAAAAVSSEKSLDLFQKPSNWNDGYQFWDITKTALGTLGDVGVNAVKGIVRMGEGVGDAAQFGAAAVADLFGADDKAEAIRRNAQRDKVTEAFSGVDEKLNKYSVLGRTSDAAAESLGQIGGILATGGIAGALGAGAVGTTAATTGLMGLSSFGSGTSEAYEAGAEEGEAEAYGAIAGAADALSEMIFGGLGKGFKALGLSKGITSADDVLAKAVTSKIRNTLAKNTVQIGIKAGAEGLEEVLAGTMQAAGKKATYMSERDFADILADENLLEQFVVGSLASGITQVPSFVSANRAGIDLVSDGGAEDAQGKFADLRDKYADFSEIERTGLASGAKEDDIRMAGELSSALGKKIRFFREEAKNGTINNGEYHEDTDEIWINARSKNVKAQIVAHELTHSIEKHDGYRQLVNMAMEKLEAEQKAKGKTIDDLYRQKEMLYADGNVRLGSYEEITSELVAEFVEKRLLTDEASIKSLVSENRTLGQRIREWFDSLLAKMGNASAKEREYIRQMRDVYARALGERVSDTKAEHVSHSLQRIDDTYYVKADRVIFTNEDGTPASERDVFNALVGETIETPEGEIEIVKRLPGKSIYDELYKRRPRYDGVQDIKALNSEINYNMEELLENTSVKEPDILDQEGKHSKQGIVSFDTRTVKFYDGDRAYDVEIDIAKLQNGKKIGYAKKYIGYDAELTKKIQEAEAMGEKSQLNQQPVSNNSISQNGGNVNRKFSVSKVVEETKDLIAVHNLNSDKLMKSIALGGMPMPSIAIAKAEVGHENFGDISLVFDKSTIDPQASAENKVYSGDAWTPTYPPVEYKVNDAVERRVRDKYYDLAERIGYDEARSMYRYAENLDDSLNRAGGEEAMLQRLYDDTGMMQIYLQDVGRGKVEPIMREVTVKVPEAQAFVSEYLIEVLGADLVSGIKAPDGVIPKEHRRAYMDAHGTEIRDAYKQMRMELYGDSEVDAAAKAADAKAFELLSLVNNAYKYMQNGGTTVSTTTDTTATNEAIRAAASDGYREWVDGLFRGVQDKAGIRNKQDTFDKAGNRRSWDATHYEETLENVVRAMKESGEKGISGSGGGDIFGASTQEFSSIEDIKKTAGRIQNLTNGEYQDIKRGFRERFSELAGSLPKNKDSFSAMDDAANMLVEAVVKYKTKKGIDGYLRRESQGWANYSPDVTEELISLVNDIRAMPTQYFEAKPQRAVSFDEVAAFVIPRNADIKVKQELLNRGYSIAEYDPDVPGDRAKVLNGMDKYKFSISKSDDPDNKRVMPKRSAAGTKARARQEQQARMRFEQKVMNRGFDNLSPAEQEHYRDEIVGQYSRKYDDYKKKRDALIASGYRFAGVDDYVEKVVGSVEDAAIDANTFLIHYQEGVFGDPTSNPDIRYSVSEADTEASGVVSEREQKDALDFIRKKTQRLKAAYDRLVKDAGDGQYDEETRQQIDFAYQQWQESKETYDMMRDAAKTAEFGRKYLNKAPIDEQRLGEDLMTVEQMGEAEFLRGEEFGYHDMMAQMEEDEAARYEEWREMQKQERVKLREVEDDLDRQFEQAEKERREINRRQREEDRKRRIERSEIQTVEQRLEENLRSAQLERSDIDQMRRNASEEYQMIIDDIQERYDALKNKNTSEANTLLRRIARMESRARTEDEAYQKRIFDIDEKIGRIQTEIQRKESPTEQRNMRRDLHESILYRIKEAFSKRGFDFDKVLAKAKDLSTFATVNNTPQRVMEKSLGYKEGRILSDLTIDQAARNETEAIRWLNGFTDKKDGVLAKLSKKYNIKPGSKESAAAQMYAEGFYVSDKKEIVEYGDRELAADFPDAQVRENIKGLARDPIIRQIYDETLDAINASRTRNAFPEIKKLDNYYLHFRAMDDTFSRLGIPFNPNDIRAKDLPTDLNGVTADLKPGQPYFASAKHRLGKRTSFDLLGGMEKYLTSAKNQIYHIDDIQTLRALRNYVADMYGQAEGLSNLDDLSDEEVEARIKDVYDSHHLSTFAKFLNEEANVLAGKTSLIDRGLEGVIGRRGITFLNDVNRQVGANMVGYNISSSLTNFLAPVQAFAKMNKAAFIKGFAQTVENRMKSITGNGDDFAEKSDVIVRRKGADRFHRTAWQKMSDPGYLLMGMVDDISTEIIARAKYNELTAKGMDAETANRETDKWVSRLMGDRSLGQMPQIFNSKMLGLVTKFQLEVRNQLDSQFYDTIKEAQVQYEEIGDKTKRNAKTAAKVAATFAELALAQHVFGSVFESIAGYNPAFDIIEVIATVLGLDDDEESEDTALDNIEQGVLALIEDLPYSSVIMDGGRIPISSALPIGELVKGEDEYGNEINRLKTAAEALPYYVLPGGYGQAKKTAKGVSMFTGDKEVTGSYTDSGNLRFPVKATPGNIAQAAVFGQWANENARDYFDNERKPANERQAMGYAESGLEWKEFQRYREQISKLDRDADKLALIKSLDIDQTAKEALYRYLVASAKKDGEGNIIGSSEDERLAALYATGLGFSDYADAKLKQAELNADEGLTANQRATRFYAWAASEGYTDEQTDAITEQFKFSSGFKVEPTQYKKLIGGGVSPDNAVLVTDALSGASRAIDKINAIWSTGLTGKQLDNAVKAVVTEGWYERYRKVIDANVPLDVLTWVLDNADANGNDSIDNEERVLILSQLVLSQKELSALWEATGGSEKSNPYKGTTGVSMPKIDLPKIELPKIELPKIGG